MEGTRRLISVMCLVLVGSSLTPLAFASQPNCSGRRATIVGTAQRDTLVGTSGVDVIVGRAGDDDIKGKEGDDIVCGGGGWDTISGGRGQDIIRGGHQYDSIAGGPGDDVMRGGGSTDTVEYFSAGHGVKVKLESGTATGQGSDRLSGSVRLSALSTTTP